MSMIDTQDFKKGTWIELEGKPWMVVEVHKHAPTARGGKTLVQTKLRNLLDQQLIQRAFKSGEMFGVPDLRRRVVSFLFRAGDTFTFMDKENYDQFEMPIEALAGGEGYLTDGLEAKAVYYNDALVGIELPEFLDMEVESVVPGTRGDTSGKVTTPATTTTGLVIDVPLFVKRGDKIRVSTKTGEFQSRS